MVSQIKQAIAAGDELLARHRARLDEWSETLDTWSEYPGREEAWRRDEAFGWALEASAWSREIIGQRLWSLTDEARRPESVLWMQHVHFLGRGPFSALDLSEMSGPTKRWTVNRHGVDPVDLLVVGRADWDANAIDTVVRQPGGPPQVLPQEGFVDRLLFGHDWWADRRRMLEAERSHPGLAQARRAYPANVRWPSDAPIAEVAEPIALDGESELHRLGYQITGMSRDERWAVLTREAIPVLGVALVRQTIERHMALRRSQYEGESRYEHALAEWAYDLDRIGRAYR